MSSQHGDRSSDEMSVEELNTSTGEFGEVKVDESGELPDDVIFGLLKNQRRRDTLRFLDENDGESTLSELSEHIAAKENDIEVRQLSSDQRKRVYIGLYQCHLPKMDNADVIDFDKNRGDVELREPAEQLLQYIRQPETESAGSARPTEQAGPMEPTESVGPAQPDGGAARRRSPSNDLLAVGVGLVVAAGLAGVPGFRRIPDRWLAGAAAGGFLASRLTDDDRR